MKDVRILMCRPEHFTVDYVINPWMEGNVENSSPERAMRQWCDLRDRIARVADVVEIEPNAELPDMVFTANAGTVCGKRAVVSRFFHPERHGESAHFAHWFAGNGFEVFEMPDGVCFEGAGDSLLDRSGEWIWAAHGYRTDLESHRYLADWLGWEVVSLQLADPYFYHLDTCMCPLADGYLIYYPAAFEPESRAEIEHRVPVSKRIVVSDEDAEQFACNAVTVGRHVILNRASAALRGRLQQAGFELHEVNLAEFIKSGGSAKCLTLKVTEPEPTVAARASA